MSRAKALVKLTSTFSSLKKSNVNYIPRRFGSTEPSKDDYQFPEEGFTSVWWTRSLAFIFGTYMYFKFDALMFKEGEHPITKWIDYHMETEEESKAKQVQLLRQAQERARIRLLECDAQPEQYRYLDVPELFNRASPNCIVPGSQTDLSDLVIERDA